MSEHPTVNLDEIIARVPGWGAEEDLKVSKIGGLTNTNYLVETHKRKYVLRISGDNSALLGINRQVEHETMQVASANGLGPEVLYFFQPEGHLVTHFIEGRHWTYEEYCQPENLARMVAAVKAVHNLPPIRAKTSPFHRVEKYLQHTRELGVPYPEGFGSALKQMVEIKNTRLADPFPALGLCHNDLFALNFIDAGELVFIDWEFAGMGDIFYDLATLAYTFDSVGEIPAELQDYILECYFGWVDDALRTRMRHMKFMVLFYSVMWGLLQHGLQNAGIIPSIDGFNYLAYAQFMLRTILEKDFN